MGLTSHKSQSIESVIPDRKSCSLIVISTEGKYTEPRYFRSLAPEESHRLKIIITENKNNESSPNRVLARLKDHLANNDEFYRDLDYACIVVDVDDHATLDATCQEAKDLGYHVLVSNPSFELWLVLHRTDINGFVTRESLNSMLDDIYRKSNRQGYDKTKYDLSVLLSGLHQAIKRAEKLDIDKDKIVPRNPCTRVYKVAQRIIDDLTD